MHRDAHLVARNAFVLPGGLLAFYGLLGVAATVFTELRSSACAAPGQVYVGGLCWNLLPWAVAVFLLGAALVAFGLVLHRGRPSSFHAMLLPGTGVHFALALLGSFVIVPLLAGLVRYLQAGAPGTVPAMSRIGGTEIAQWKLLVLLSVVGLLMFVPTLALYLRQLAVRRAFLEAVGTEDVAAEAEERAEEPAARRAAPVAPVPASSPSRPKRPPEDRPVPYDLAAAPPPVAPAADGWMPVERAPRGTAEAAQAEEADEEPLAADEAAGAEAPGDGADQAERSGDEADEGVPVPAAPERMAVEETDWFGAGPDPGADEEDGGEADPEATTPWAPLDAPDEAPDGTAWATDEGPDEEPSDAPDEALTPAVPEPDVFSGLAEEERLSLQATLDEAGARRCHAVMEAGPCDVPAEAGRRACAEHGCQARPDGRPCPEPRSLGLRYCVQHACQGRTRSGEPCQNMSLAGSLHCALHGA